MARVPCLAFASEREASILADTVSPLLSTHLAVTKTTVAIETTRELETLAGAAPGTIRILSMLPFVTDDHHSWEDIAQIIEQACERLADTGDPLLIVTVFRSVDFCNSHDADQNLLRIRRLNMLVPELSRQFGAFVIDLDRTLADIGGRNLDTDFRLGGALTSKVTGHEIARSILANGLDAHVPYNACQQALSALDAERPQVARSAKISRNDVIAMGKGRNRQKVQFNTSTVQDDHVTWLVNELFKGRIGLRQGAGRLVGAIRRRGIRESLQLLVAALRQSIGRKHAT